MTKQSADDGVEYESRYPVNNDPNSNHRADNRKRYVVAGRVQCSTCKKWKLLEEFHKAKNLTFGICGICKECACAKSKAYYNNQKEKSKYRDAEGNLVLPKARLRRRYERLDKYEKHVEQFGRKENTDEKAV